MYSAIKYTELNFECIEKSGILPANVLLNNNILIKQAILKLSINTQTVYKYMPLTFYHKKPNCVCRRSLTNFAVLNWVHYMHSSKDRLTPWRKSQLVWRKNQFAE